MPLALHLAPRSARNHRRDIRPSASSGRRRRPPAPRAIPRSRRSAGRPSARRLAEIQLAAQTIDGRRSDPSPVRARMRPSSVMRWRSVSLFPLHVDATTPGAQHRSAARGSRTARAPSTPRARRSGNRAADWGCSDRSADAGDCRDPARPRSSGRSRLQPCRTARRSGRAADRSRLRLIACAPDRREHRRVRQSGGAEAHVPQIERGIQQVVAELVRLKLDLPLREERGDLVDGVPSNRSGVNGEERDDDDEAEDDDQSREAPKSPSVSPCHATRRAIGAPSSSAPAVPHSAMQCRNRVYNPRGEVIAGYPPPCTRDERSDAPLATDFASWMWLSPDPRFDTEQEGTGVSMTTSSCSRLTVDAGIRRDWPDLQ